MRMLQRSVREVVTSDVTATAQDEQLARAVRQ
jgi:hypothetical protein